MEFSLYEQALLSKWVSGQEAARVGRKTTVVCLQMKNGYEVIGTSACVNPEEYEYDLGVFYATKDALTKVEDIAGYIEHENLLT